ncbi:MAG TPA: M23 family metallopeptidase [Thermoanaerobaculia bacterium]|nr:M23 family metallopeptidase [Thermoanaerobaculia bacterium]
MRTTRRMGPGLWLLLLLIVAVVAIAGIISLFGWGPSPKLEVKAPPGIGQRTHAQVAVHESARGLAGLKVVLTQNGKEEVLAQESFTPRPLWKVWGERTPERTLDVELGKKKQTWLANGEAVLRVEAARAGGMLRHPGPVVQEVKLPVRVFPPALNLLSSQTYAAQGGSEAVVYHVDKAAVRHGVEAGKYFFPGSPLPGHDGEYFVIFGIPYDMATPDPIKLYAQDALGNEARLGFIERWTPRPVGKADIKLTDQFLQKVVPEISSHRPDVQATDDLLATYLKINGELRRKNDQELLELGAKSRPEFLWSQPFLPFPNGQVMERFAARRTYFYGDKEVDHQTHLGFDLASTQHAPVPAANRGIVMVADYFGIYGNTVILDHGYGLMTLYAHLSSIDVKPGQTVERGQRVGISGSTGLAGGDHLHFATLMRGLPVTPVEWWDPHWITDRIARKLDGALPFAKQGGAAQAAPTPAAAAGAPAAPVGATPD